MRTPRECWLMVNPGDLDPSAWFTSLEAAQTQCPNSEIIHMREVLAEHYPALDKTISQVIGDWANYGAKGSHSRKLEQTDYDELTRWIVEAVNKHIEGGEKCKSVTAQSETCNSGEPDSSSLPVAQAGEQSGLWTVKDSEEPNMHDIDTGHDILRMVTDDYQMAMDICAAHNAALPYVASKEATEKVTYYLAERNREIDQLREQVKELEEKLMKYSTPTTEVTWMDEARQIAAQCWCDKETQDRTMDTVLAEAVAKRIATWMDTSAQAYRDAGFYRGIITQIGELFGVAAKTSDDGSIQQDVVALKVPELVKSLRDQNKKLVEAAKGLVDKLELVHADLQYTSVWLSYANHGGVYNGPKYDKELEKLTSVLADLQHGEQPRKDT